MMVNQMQKAKYRAMSCRPQLNLQTLADPSPHKTPFARSSTTPSVLLLSFLVELKTLLSFINGFLFAHLSCYSVRVG